MEKQNVTLSLSKDLLKQAKHLAVEKGTSLSGLLSEFLEQLASDEKSYRLAAGRLKRRLKEGIDLGTKGRLNWKREDLHGR